MSEILIDHLEIQRYTTDLLYVLDSNMFINEKGYIQKLIDNLYKVGYYKSNESIIPLLRKGK